MGATASPAGAADAAAAFGEPSAFVFLAFGFSALGLVGFFESGIEISC
jgi:hypothetical protein